MRPLTLTQPKPAVRLVDRPFVRFMVDWLARHGIEHVVMACGFRPDLLRDALGEGGAGGPRISYVEEEEPLGTAGPLRLADEQGLLGERFLALNGDVLADLDLTELLAAHEEVGAAATLALHPVADPAGYGLVRREGGPDGPGMLPATPSGAVIEFLEKPEPSQMTTDEISAGAYVLEREVLGLIPAGREVSIEREVFPRLVGRGLYGQRLDGYWMDIGTPDRYLQASWDILECRLETELGAELGESGLLIEGDPAVDTGAEVAPPALVEAGCTVAAGARVGPRAVVGTGSSLAAGSSVVESVLSGGCRLAGGASVSGSILAERVVVGEGAVVQAGAVIGEGARVGAGVTLPVDARVPPGEEIEA